MSLYAQSKTKGVESVPLLFVSFYAQSKTKGVESVGWERDTSPLLFVSSFCAQSKTKGVAEYKLGKSPLRL